MDHYKKYLKYKNKYLKLKSDITNLIGGNGVKLNIYHNIHTLGAESLGVREKMLANLLKNRLFNGVFLDPREYKKQLSEKYNTAPNVFIMFYDIYSWNRLRMNEEQLSIFLDELETKGTLIPNKNLIKQVGTKKYVISFKDLMLPGTLTYPVDESKISSLETGKYMLKYGMSGANATNYIIHGTGKNIMERIKSMTVKNVGNPDFAIVQPFSDIFKRCSEYRVLLIDGNIVDFYYGIVGSEPKESVSEIGQNALGSFFYNYFKSETSKKEPLIINKKIYTFLKNIVEKIKREITFGTVPDYLRLDIIIDCSDNPAGDFKNDILPDIVNPEWDGNIYLNEIENLASGVYGSQSNTQVNDINNQAVITNERYDSLEILKTDIYNRMIKLIPEKDRELVIDEKFNQDMWNEFSNEDSQKEYMSKINNSIKWFEYLKSLNLSTEQLVLYNNVVSANRHFYDIYKFKPIVNIPINCDLTQRVEDKNMIDEIITAYKYLSETVDMIDNARLSVNTAEKKCLYHKFIANLRNVDQKLKTFYEYVMSIVNSNKDIKTLSLPSPYTYKFRIFNGKDFYEYFDKEYYRRFEKVQLDVGGTFDESIFNEAIDGYHDKEREEYGIPEFNP